VVVEGDAEEALCLHLKELVRRKGERIVVRNAHGGSPRSIIGHARNLLGQAAYNRLVMLLDSDVPFGHSDEKLWSRLPVSRGGDKHLLFSRPCLEAEVIRLLGASAHSETKQCRRLLEKQGLDKRTLGDRRTWQRIVPHDDIRPLRARSPWLNELLNALGIEI